MREINSTNNEYIKYLFKLKEKKYRILEDKFLIEGYHLVEEAYKANNLIEILVTSTDNIVYKDIEITKVNSQIIEKLSSTLNPQNIIGVCKINKSKSFQGNKFLLLDNINDPGNMGTLIRSALGFGIDTIVLSKNCVDIYNEKVLRATQGALFKTNIVIDELEKIIEDLKEKDVKIIGTSLNADYELKKLPKYEKFAIILGNEANGVREEILNLTDVNVKIEMNPQLESLNVSVAGSIMMYYLYE